MAETGGIRERYLAAVVAVQQQLLERTAGQSYERTLQILGEAAGADRSYYFENFTADDGLIRSAIRAEWCSPGIATDNEYPEKQDIRLEECITDAFVALSRSRAYGRTLDEAPPAARGYMKRTGAKSILLLPVIAAGEFRGFFGFDNCREQRPWQPDEIDLLRAAAGAAAVALEREQVEGRLREALERLHHHIEQSPLMVIEWDHNFRITFWSPRAEEVFGWSSAELIGKAWWDWRFIHEDDMDRVARTAGMLSDGTHPHTVSRNRNYTKSGAVVHCEWYNSAIRGPGGRIVSTLSLVLDVSERVRAEEEARQALEHSAQAEKMAALGQMASGLAHDFNNALTVIVGKADLLLVKYALPDRVKATVEDVRTAGLDAAATVRRLQEFVRTRSADPEKVSVDLAALADQAAELTRHRWSDQAFRRGVTIKLSMEHGRRAIVRANPAELRELLTNLIFNAVDAMPKGGTLSMETGAVDGRAFLRVSDTGVGMDEETLRRCFDPFFTTKGVEGTGLGLALSWSIARRQNGELTVESAFGHGTCFTLWLPIAVPGTAATVRPPANAASDHTSRRVLVIDDRPDVVGTLSAMLRQLDHTVESAGSGAEGLERLDQGQYDLVITDLGMPGVDGKEVARRSKQVAPHIPVVLLTGWADEINGTGEQPEFVDRVVAKPLSLERLRRVLSELGPMSPVYPKNKSC